MFVLACGFLGSWLLFAGPLYQGVMELRNEGREMERVSAHRSEFRLTPMASAWWWLLPPVKLALDHRLRQRDRARYLATLPPEDAAVMVSYVNKATGWLIVSVGGLLLALEATWNLLRTWRVTPFWSIAAWLLIAAAVVALVAAEVLRTRRVEGAN